MKNVEVIHLDPKRKERQLEFDEALRSLYNDYFSFLNRHANIREKVRAKHIFREKTGLSQEALLEEKWENQFEHWFAFDYRNIQGTLMFDLYFKKNKHNMTETMVVLSALLLTTVVEPIIVTGIRNEWSIEGENPLDHISQSIHSLSNPISGVKTGDLLFIRKIKSGYRMTVLGPYLHVPRSQTSTLLHQLVSDYEDFSNSHQETTFRTFLRAHAIEYLKG